MSRYLYFAFIVFPLSTTLCFGQGAKDVEIPYTVGDRELILEIKFKLDAYQKNTDAKLEAMNEKLDTYQKSNDAKFEAMNEKLDTYQKANDAKFEGMNARFDFLETLMIAMFAAIMASIAGLAGYLVWTQKRERQLAKATVKVQQTENLTPAQFESLVERIERLEQVTNLVEE